ncbi:MAG: glycosyltransferase family 39 protein [Acidobacteriota bacterium]|mgnify:CR=1 FL=1
MRPRGWVAAVVFALSLARCAVYLDRARIAEGHLDPVGKIAPQDEALYAHTSLHMAREGDWLTPRFMGRYALYKPPLLYWLSALSVKLAGASAVALRLPCLLAAAAASALVFAWLWRMRSLAAAVTGWLLLLMNPLWHVLARVALTDMLLAAASVGALWCLGRDPRLARHGPFVGFGVLLGLAILAKAVAGLFPLLVVLGFTLLMKGPEKPSWKRLAQACAVAATVALPWHLYQLALHPRWFLAEYVGVEILQFTLGAPPQTSAENHVLFYVRRLVLTDPILCCAALAAVPALLKACRGRSAAAPMLMLSWLGVGVTVALFNQYRNFAYLLVLIPALCLAAGGYGPLAGRRARWAVPVALLAAFGLKAAIPGRPWSLPFLPASKIPTARVLENYCEKARAAELLIVWQDDEFYATLLPLHRVRYVLWGEHPNHRPAPLDFRQLGIMVTTDEFLDLDRWRPVFRQRLKAWSLDSDEPLATVVTFRSPEEVARLVRAHPQSDFLLPGQILPRLDGVETTHQVIRVSAARVLLLSRAVADRSRHRPASCRL